jgi:amidophosphoribosyltransferase
MMLVCGIVSQFIVLLLYLLCSCAGSNIRGLIDIAGAANEDQMEEGWVISSESCGFLSIGARYEREVRPGEIVELTKHGIRNIGIVERPNSKPQAFCIFEYVYFARSDSIFEGW